MGNLHIDNKPSQVKKITGNAVVVDVNSTTIVVRDNRGTCINFEKQDSQKIKALRIPVYDILVP